MNDYFWQILFHLSLFAIVVPCTVTTLTWHKQPKSMRLFGLGLICYFLVFLCSMNLKIPKFNGIYQYLSALSDCIFFSIFYYQFSQKRHFKSIMFGVALLVCVSIIIEYFVFYNQLKNPQLSFLFKNIFLFVASLYILKTLFLQIKISNLATRPIFWIATTKFTIICYSMIFEMVKSVLLEKYLNIYLIMYAIDLLLHIVVQMVFARAIYLGQYFHKSKF